MKILKANFRETALFIFSVYFIALSYGYPVSVNAKQNDYWPTKGWKTSTPEAQGMDSNLLANMFEEIKKVNIKVHSQDKHGVHSITIVRNGALVLDVYFHDFTPNKLHFIRSCTKSIMSILIGIAIDQKYIKNIHRPVISFFPEKRFANLDERKKAMTLEHLLMMATGLKCRDSYKYRWKGIYDLWKYADDWVQYILDIPMEEYPGTRFEYCNSASFLLSAIFQKVTGMKTKGFAKKHLFNPLGITDVAWKTNPHGITIGWGTIFLKSHDMAKIGLLCLKQGQWQDRQIVSKEWMEISTRKHIDTDMPSGAGYGYQWWVGTDGTYAAVGGQGQRIFVIPSKNLIAVFTSQLESLNRSIPEKLMVTYIIPAIKSNIALPFAPEANHRLNTLINKYVTSQ